MAAELGDELLEATKPASANRGLDALKKALVMAWERARTPVDCSGLVKGIAENNERTVYLGMEGVKLILLGMRVDRHVVREIVSHTSIKTTERYAHVVVAPHEALSKLGDLHDDLHRTGRRRTKAVA